MLLTAPQYRKQLCPLLHQPQNFLNAEVEKSCPHGVLETRPQEKRQQQGAWLDYGRVQVRDVMN